MTKNNEPSELDEVVAVMKGRPKGREGSPDGSTGDIVLRLRELGIFTHKGRVGEVADILFGETIRETPTAHRRVSDDQFDVICRAFVLCDAFGFSMHELGDYINNPAAREGIRAHLERGLKLLDTIEVLAEEGRLS